MRVDTSPPRVALLAPEAADSSGPALREALVFAFAASDAGDALERSLEQTPLAPSPWQPDDFASDVFLDELIVRCLPCMAQGQRVKTSGVLLRRILSQPEVAPSTALFRQGILGELVLHPSFRQSAEKLLAALATFRSLLARGGGARHDPHERRMSILRAVREVVGLAKGGFEGATSGLSRIAAWGEAALADPAYQRLADLLAYEEGTAEVDVRLRLGVDGRIRDFQVLGTREPVESPFHQSAWRRLLVRLTLFLRGARFDAHELLSRLAFDVFEGVLPLLPAFFSLAAGLELYLSALGFRDLALRAGLPVVLPSFAGEGHAVRGLWNPLLLPEESHAPKGAKSARVVPCDLQPFPGATRVILTGPNSGGKTRLLQAIAITQILGQAGLFVPAAAADLPWATGLFVSLIEHTRADQAEGKLGTELLRIRRLFESLQRGSLVIMDELCSGTNPDEGEEIFRLVVKLLAELRPMAFITTHFLKFAARLLAEEEGVRTGDREGDPAGLEFLKVELDSSENPTFQFVPGVATSSLAHRTAVRLGVTEEALRLAIRAKNP